MAIIFCFISFISGITIMYFLNKKKVPVIAKQEIKEERKKAKEDLVKYEKEMERIETLLRNIDVYDGTSIGQEKLDD